MTEAGRQIMRTVERFAGNYRTITGASLATATRDLVDLVEKGALIRNGERRYARYRLAAQ